MVFVCVLCKTIYFMPAYTISCLSYACLSVVLSSSYSAWENCSVLVRVPVQCGGRAWTLCNGRVFKDSPPSCTDTICNIQCHSSCPQWWHCSVQGKLLGMLGILVVFKWLKYYCVTVAGLVCWGSEMCLIWWIVCFCRDWDKVREKGGYSTCQIPSRA